MTVRLFHLGDGGVFAVDGEDEGASGRVCGRKTETRF